MSDESKPQNADKGTEVKDRLEAAINELMGIELLSQRLRASLGSAFELVGDIQRGRPLTRRERILASLAGETRSQSYLADDTDIPYSALVAELTLMVADKLCEKVGKGAYRATVAA